MMKPRCPPILKLSRSRYSRGNTHGDEYTAAKRHWTAYIAPAFAVFLLLIVQPSWFILVTTLYLGSTDRLWRRGAMHLAITTTLVLLALNSLSICVFRDPGRPRHDDLEDIDPITSSGNTGHDSDSKPKRRDTSDSDGSRTLVEEEESLIDEEDEDPNDFNSDRRWCRICWAPKPDRTHHCSSCGRCVLRMDHHCPWISQCVGHRTHPAFLHLLTCVTILSSYIAIIAGSCIYDLIFAPIAHAIDDPTPLHALFLVVMGTVFFIVIGSFLSFHLYLCFTNQTTLEQLSPFLLLKYLPKSRLNRHVAGASITGNSNPSHLAVPPSSNPNPNTNSNSSSRRADSDPDSPYYFPSPPATPPAHKATLSVPGQRDGSDSQTLISTSKVFSPSPVATNAAVAEWPPSNMHAPGGRNDHAHNSNSGSGSSTRQSQSQSQPRQEWDEHSMSFKQRHLVRLTAGRIGLWDLGWRRNFSATLGFGYPLPNSRSFRRRRRSTRDDDDDVEGDEAERERLTSNRRSRHSTSTLSTFNPATRTSSSSTSRTSTSTSAYSHGHGHGQGRNGSDMPLWQWILAVLLYGGPPRGDGRTFPRNPRAKSALHELAHGLEMLEQQERGAREDWGNNNTNTNSNLVSPNSGTALAGSTRPNTNSNQNPNSNSNAAPKRGRERGRERDRERDREREREREREAQYTIGEDVELEDI